MEMTSLVWMNVAALNGIDPERSQQEKLAGTIFGSAEDPEAGLTSASDSYTGKPLQYLESTAGVRSFLDWCHKFIHIIRKDERESALGRSTDSHVVFIIRCIDTCITIMYQRRTHLFSHVPTSG